MLTLLVALLLSAAAREPRHVHVELIRPAPGAPRIFVAAELPDQSTVLFLVDTGADTSVLSPSVAQRLGMRTRPGGEIVGISRAAQVGFGTLPWVGLGDLRVPNVEVAVGLPPPREGDLGLPVVGILGNNVWSHFLVEIDYRADELILHKPGSRPMPKGSAPMRFDRGHIHTPIRLFSPDGTPALSTVLALDTGAPDIVLLGGDDHEVTAPYTEGLEPVLGVTSSTSGPWSAHLRRTRRFEVGAVEVGGMKARLDSEVRWLDYDRSATASRLSVRGLIGHEVFEGRRVFLDYAGRRFAMRPSPRASAPSVAWRDLIDDEMARYRDDPAHLLDMARLWLAVGDEEQAAACLAALLALKDPSVTSQHRPARLLAADLRRAAGDPVGARALLAPLSPAELVEEGVIVGVVNGLLLDGQHDQAADVADAAVSARPQHALSWLAVADLRAAEGDAEGAWQALLRVVEITGDPDAQALRRARVALQRGDRDGALALLRDAVQANPLDGRPMWFYALIAAEQAADVTTARADLDVVVGDTHPQLRPHDFLAAAFRELGDEARAKAEVTDGALRDCQGRADADPAGAQNCQAWYFALGGVELQLALALVEQALGAEGPRSDFLDTKAMVHLARGELAEATEAAVLAARLAPDDPYMLWQVQRLRDVTSR